MNEDIVQRVENGGRLAWRVKEAPGVLGLSKTSFYEEVKRRKIILTDTYGLLTLEEALRYLREETQLARRKMFKRRINRPITA